MRGGVFVTQQPSLREVVSPVPVLKPILQPSKLDFEYDDELLRITHKLLDEAKLIRVHPVQYELNVVKSQLKEMAFIAESQLEMTQKSFRIDFEYLQKRWRREYRQGYAFMSELAAKEERQYSNVDDAIRRCEQRVRSLEEALGE